MVLQVALSATHVPSQVPPQHSVSIPQLVPSARQPAVASAQCCPSQYWLQQSSAPTQSAPMAPHSGGPSPPAPALLGTDPPSPVPTLPCPPGPPPPVSAAPAPAIPLPVSPPSPAPATPSR